jgi:hypothetical protein
MRAANRSREGTILLPLVLRALAFNFAQRGCRGVGPAADAKMLPQPEPRAISKHLIVPSIGSRDVACAEWSNVRRFEHFL